jgi:flagellar hook-associated protein 1
MSGLLGISVGALNNAMTGVTVAGHNIANANTPGFSRQNIEQTTNTPVMTGGGYVGQGANVNAITRMYDSFLTQQVRQATSQATESSTYVDQMKRIDNLLGDPTAGLSPALTEFFSGVQQVAAKPADMAARQSMLSSAQSLAGRFQSIDSQFNNLRSAVNNDIQSSVSRINGIAKQISGINDKIALLSANATAGQQPNDLLDQRDQMVLDLNKEIRADVVLAKDGSYGLFTSSGQPLVLGNQSYTLSTLPDAENPTDIQVTVAVGPTQMRLRAQDLSGGALGGSLAFRQGGLTDAQNALGRIAIALTEGINDQHQLGQDVNGALGGVFFQPTNSGNPNIAHANAANTGTGVASASVTGNLGDYSLLTGSDYRLAYDGANYSLTRLSDNTVTALPGIPATVDGITINVAGTPVAGDQFLITPTLYGAQQFAVALVDVRKIAAANPTSAAANINNAGSGTISGDKVTDAAALVGTPPLFTDSYQIQFSDASGSLTYDLIDTTAGGTPVSIGGVPQTGIAYNSANGATLSFNGIQFQISGAPATGDRFTVGQNLNGAGDNRNANAIGLMQAQGIMAKSNAAANGMSYGVAYGQLVSQVGNKTSQLQVSSDSLATVAAAAQQTQNQLSGVNLDEEASNLIRYQQAYQAAGKMVTIAGVLFDTILNIRS